MFLYDRTQAIYRLLVLTIALFIALVACGDDSENDVSESVQDSPEPTATTVIESTSKPTVVEPTATPEPEPTVTEAAQSELTDDEYVDLVIEFFTAFGTLAEVDLPAMDRMEQHTAEWEQATEQAFTSFIDAYQDFVSIDPPARLQDAHDDMVAGFEPWETTFTELLEYLHAGELTKEVVDERADGLIETQPTIMLGFNYLDALVDRDVQAEVAAVELE